MFPINVYNEFDGNVTLANRRKVVYFDITFTDGRCINLKTYGMTETADEYVFSVADTQRMHSAMWYHPETYEDHTPHKHVTYKKNEILYITRCGGEV